MKKCTYLALVLISLSLSCNNASKHITNDTINNSLDSLLQATIDEGLSAGIAISVVSSSEILFQKAFGVKTYDKASLIQTTDAFDFSSIVKTVMSTAVMQLVEQGNIQLNNSGGDYLPILTGDLSKPTVMQLLSHSSGIQFSKQEPSTDGSLRSRDLILANPPGTKLQYSNAAFYTVGKMIAEQTDVSLPKYVTNQIFNPIGMTHSSIDSFDEMDNLSIPHTVGENGLAVVSRPIVTPSKIGNGIFYSTIEDMALWAQMHLNKGTLGRVKLLNADSYDQLWTPNLDTGWDDMKAAAGLGWFIGTVNGKMTASHIGGTNGYSAALVIFPEDDRALVIAGNSNKLPREALIAAISKLIFP